MSNPRFSKENFITGLITIAVCLFLAWLSAQIFTNPIIPGMLAIAGCIAGILAMFGIEIKG